MRFFKILPNVLPVRLEEELVRRADVLVDVQGGCRLTGYRLEADSCRRIMLVRRVMTLSPSVRPEENHFAIQAPIPRTRCCVGGWFSANRPCPDGRRQILFRLVDDRRRPASEFVQRHSPNA